MRELALDKGCETCFEEVQRLADTFLFHGWFQIIDVAVVILALFVPEFMALFGIPFLIITHAIMTFSLTRPIRGMPQPRLARIIRIEIFLFGTCILLTIAAVVINILAQSSSNLVLIPIGLFMIAPAVITICKGHFIAQLSRRAVLHAFAPWSIRISYYFAATLLIWMTSLLHYSGKSRTPEPYREVILNTTSTLVFLASLAATIFYFLLAARFRNLVPDSRSVLPLPAGQTNPSPANPE